MVDVALVLEDAQLGAYGGIAGVAGELRHHVGGGRAAKAVEDVHDLALAARERDVMRNRFRHMRVW